jgi:hypothetical protein
MNQVMQMLESLTPSQLVQSYGYNIQDIIEASNHLRRLRKLNHSDTDVGMDTKVITKLNKLGFHLFVKAPFIEQFKYAASLRHNENPCSVTNSPWFSRKSCIYMGDIPSFAIERAELAQHANIRYLTIHSNQPLPLVRITSCPILLGWQKNPRIVCNQNGCYSLSECFAVVIAIWSAEGSDML